MDDSGSLSKRQRTLHVASMLGWLVQGAVLDEIVIGTVLLGLIAIFFGVMGSDPAGQVAAGVLGVVGVVLTLGGRRARWPDRLMWLVAPSAGLVELAAALWAVHS